MCVFGLGLHDGHGGRAPVLVATFVAMALVGSVGCSARYSDIEPGDKAKIWYDNGEYVSLSRVIQYGERGVSSEGVHAKADDISRVDIAVSPYVKIVIVGVSLFALGWAPVAF